MKFVVATYGAEGDASPFATLCRGLMDAGHEARLLADAGALGGAHALGVPAAALAGDIRSAIGSDHASNCGSIVKVSRAKANERSSLLRSGKRRLGCTESGCSIIIVIGEAEDRQSTGIAKSRWCRPASSGPEKTSVPLIDIASRWLG
jgi:hypothetical protein